MTAHIRSIVIGVVTPLVIAAIAAVVLLVSLPEMPDPAATHWGVSGRPDGFGSPIGGLVLLALLAVGWAVFAAVAARPIADATSPNLNQRIVLASGPFIVTLVAVLTAGSALIQRGVADAAHTPSITPVLMAAAALALALGVAAWFLLPKHVTPASAAGAELMQLGSTERATWSNELRLSPLMSTVIVGILVLAVLAGGVIMWAVAPFWAFLVWVILFVAVMVLVAVTLFWRVSVDASRFVVRSVFGWPRFVIPVSEVRSAAVVTVDPLREFGGYGIRWAGRGRFGVVTRAGEGLEVTRRNGRSITVTVDDSAAAAGLLNALVARG